MVFAKRIFVFFALITNLSCGQFATPAKSSLTSFGKSKKKENKPAALTLARIPTRIDGVNLPHLDPRDQSFGPDFIQDPTFLSNMRDMRWNTFRLPIGWNHFTDEQGKLIDARLDEAAARVSLILINLAKAWQAGPRTEKYLLILDFHQYKFGDSCGADGVPEFYSKNLGLSRNDPNCVFKAFHHFWNNTNEMQTGWLNFIGAITQQLLPIINNHRDWLTVGIEPMNEPQPGAADDVFTDSWPSAVWSALNFKSLLEDAQSSQINSSLIPFYRRAIGAIAQKMPLASDRENYVMIFDPFVWDHLDLSFSVDVFGAPLRLLHIVADGRYDEMKSLNSFPSTQEPLTWLAAPHHYDGTIDGGLLSALPSNVGDILSHYPNQIFDRNALHKRMAKQRERMRAAGMTTMFFGEWGTPTDLKGSGEEKNGAESWIKDSQSAMAQHSDGGLWWRYEFDESAGQDSYYLLQGHVAGANDESKTVPRQYEQRLKCSPKSALARQVFGRCPVPKL